MKLLANENIPLITVNILKEEGLDIISISEENSGITDKEVIDLAVQQSRTIITFDRDYGDLIFNKGMKPPNGVIYLRFDCLSPDYPAMFLLQHFNNTSIDYWGKLTVITENSIRQRKYL